MKNSILIFITTAFMFSLFYQNVFAAGPATVNLNTAGNFVILSKAGVTTTGVTKIVGNIGVSPIADTSMTGFGLILNKTGKFSTSSKVSGKI